MLKDLKKAVYEANMELTRQGLVVFTWGNASGIDRQSGCLIIKPSGVAYGDLKPEDLPVVNLQGEVVEGKLKPSSDTPTHIALYKAFPAIGGVVHTHSEWATSWAQAGASIPPYGTTHTDYFYGPVPCSRKLSRKEVEQNYEANTGKVIAETMQALDAVAVPGVLVNGHGPFSWGKDAAEAVFHAAVMEEIAKMAFRTQVLGNTTPVDQFLLDKHYLRKHGKNAYYGQDSKKSF